MLIELTLRDTNESIFINAGAIVWMKRVWRDGKPIGTDIYMPGPERFSVKELPVDMVNIKTPQSFGQRFAELQYLEEQARQAALHDDSSRGEPNERSSNTRHPEEMD